LTIARDPSLFFENSFREGKHWGLLDGKISIFADFFPTFFWEKSDLLGKNRIFPENYDFFFGKIRFFVKKFDRKTHF
jgi:hypothetical protein